MELISGFNLESNRNLVEFMQPKSMGERDWGEDTLIALSPGNYTLKKLFIKAGKKGGLQYHHLKDESGYVVFGSLIIRHDNGNGQLIETIVKEGEWFRFPPNSVHQEEAITDCLIIEASTPHYNDRVRVENEYGLKEEKGLGSTKISEVNKM